MGRSHSSGSRRAPPLKETGIATAAARGIQLPAGLAPFVAKTAEDDTESESSSSCSSSDEDLALGEEEGPSPQSPPRAGACVAPGFSAWRALKGVLEGRGSWGAGACVAPVFSAWRALGLTSWWDRFVSEWHGCLVAHVALFHVVTI